MKPPAIDGLVTLGTEDRWAIFSPDDLYRYALYVRWDPPMLDQWEAQRPTLAAFCMNPSTATHTKDDPTLLKLIHYGKQEGCGGLLLRNLAAFRATDQADLAKAEDPVGPRNNEILGMDPFFALGLAAWGNFYSNRVMRKLMPSSIWIRSRNPNIHVFGLTKATQPKHPLYLKNSTRTVRWRDAA